jgi:hypothetical protein
MTTPSELGALPPTPEFFAFAARMTVLLSTTMKALERRIRLRRTSLFISSRPARSGLDGTEVGITAMPEPDSRPGLYKVRLTLDLHDVHLIHEGAIPEAESSWVS